MKYLAFVPKYHEVPYQLIAVLVPEGMVTREIWQDALALRIESLAMSEESPEKVSIEACKYLGCEVADDPRELPKKIFLNNSLLTAQLKVAGIGDEHFPIYVDENDENALEILENDSLAMWLAYAKAFVEGNKDALIAYTAGSWYQREEYKRITPHMPDKEIRPYADFISNVLGGYIDYQSSDSDEVHVFLNLYNLKFSLRHHHGCVKLSYLKLMGSQIEKSELREWEKVVTEFNRNHASKISLSCENSKNFWFKKIKKLEWYILELEFPLTATSKEVGKTFSTFFQDLRDWLTGKNISILSSSKFRDELNRDEFIKFVNDEMREKFDKSSG